MTHVILCGGNGTRLWPLSRSAMPKQFIKLFGGHSLFQKTLLRNQILCDERLILGNAEQAFVAMDQAEELGCEDCRYLLEGEGRDTAASIALASLSVAPEELLLVTPSDHLIGNDEAYAKAVQKARLLAETGSIVTIGIPPRSPETGFGYIEAEGEDVVAFHEKPDAETAREYLRSGRFFWNAGIFCFRAASMLEALKRYTPEIYESSLKVLGSCEEREIVRIPKERMRQIPATSIDYAVMEHASGLKVVSAEMEWSDLGSFDALSEVMENDEAGNLVLSKRHVSLVGVRESIVVDTDDALLIAKKGNTQQVKEIVRRLEREGSSLVHEHLTGYRPWGSYTVLDRNDGYKIKRIVVKPGRRLSLQKHYHRNEHWIVLSGSATVTVNDRTFTVNPNESTYIKAGDVHRLENKGLLPLVIIEVQVGEYTGEDDIVRLEDDYERAGNE